MKTIYQKKREQSVRAYKNIIKSLAIARATKTYGEKSVRWALGKYLTNTAEVAKLLKEKLAAERRLQEIEEKLG